jgi:putative transposase
MEIQYIQPGKPNQNAFIERFNRTFREEVLDLYLFEDPDQLREEAHRWVQRYNETWPHDSLGDLSLLEYAKRARVSTFELSP